MAHAFCNFDLGNNDCSKWDGNDAFNGGSFSSGGGSGSTIASASFGSGGVYGFGGYCQLFGREDPPDEDGVCVLVEVGVGVGVRVGVGVGK